jgi:hypothetical protein
MCEKEQNRGKEESEGSAEFAMPDCCGPMMARMMKACGPKSSGNGEAESEAGGAGAPSCCESMMARMREAFSESSSGEGEESSSDEKGSGCCS